MCVVFIVYVFKFHLKLDMKVLDLGIEHMGEHCYIYIIHSFFKHFIKGSYLQLRASEQVTEQTTCTLSFSSGMDILLIRSLPGALG